MATVELDQRTADQLHALAEVSGMTTEACLRLLLPATPENPSARLSLQDIDALLEQLAFDGPSLPADFSRVDIYDQHD